MACVFIRLPTGFNLIEAKVRVSVSVSDYTLFGILTIVFRSIDFRIFTSCLGTRGHFIKRTIFKAKRILM